jgi:hypothetical protein
MPSARELARKKPNRNERQRSRNLLMRNLLTAFDANRNHEMRRKIFCLHCKLFQQLAGKFFSIAGLQKLVCARICPVYATVRCAWQNSSIEIGFLFSALARVTRSDAGLITAILLLPFAVNCR